MKHSDKSLIDHDQEPLRVLHVVGILQRGGIETWLMHVLQTLNRQQIQIDFLVQSEQPGAYDEAVQNLGSRIWKCPIDRRRPWQYARQFKQILRQHGPYQIVHSNVHHFNGFVLRLARQMQIPVRIAHSHNDTSIVSRQSTGLRRLYILLTQFWVQRHATLGLAASREAAQDLFGPSWENDRRWQLLYYGIGLKPFADRQASWIQTEDHVEVQAKARSELGIPADAFVLGHVGRFESQKNHPFLLDIMTEIYAREPKAFLLMIGEGPLRPEIENLVAQYPWKERKLFAGIRGDVPRLMQTVMDVFLLPSFYEGLPLVGIEAQAAGLPMVLSDTITRELDVVSSHIYRVSLQQPASVWAETTLHTRSESSAESRSSAVTALQSSAFNIENCVMQLEAIYQSSVRSLKSGS